MKKRSGVTVVCRTVSLTGSASSYLMSTLLLRAILKFSMISEFDKVPRYTDTKIGNTGNKPSTFGPVVNVAVFGSALPATTFIIIKVLQFSPGDYRYGT